MNTKSELQAARQKMMEEDRARLGEPPTAEVMLAYTRGELSAEQEERVRELLVCYPELARTLTEPFPEAAAPGDVDYLPDEEFAKHWASMQKRIGKTEGGRVLPFRSPVWATAAAAALALVFGAAFINEHAKVERLSAERVQPSVSQEAVLLRPDIRRGSSASVMVLPEGQPSVLVVPMTYEQDFPRYRLEIVDTALKQTIWSDDAIELGPDQQSFTVTVPRAFLKRGGYRLVVSGVNGQRIEELDSYAVKVPPTP